MRISRVIAGPEFNSCNVERFQLLKHLFERKLRQQCGETSNSHERKRTTGRGLTRSEAPLAACAQHQNGAPMFCGSAIYSGCDDIQSGDDLEMPEVGCCDGEPEMQGSGGDQEIFEGDRNPLSGAFAFDSTGSSRYFDRDGMNGYIPDEFIYESLTLHPALLILGSLYTVNQFDYSHDR
jgi:hypothetical protein